MSQDSRKPGRPSAPRKPSSSEVRSRVDQGSMMRSRRRIALGHLEPLEPRILMTITETVKNARSPSRATRKPMT